MSMQRRDFLKLARRGVAGRLAGCAGMPGAASKARVVVVGGGYRRRDGGQVHPPVRSRRSRWCWSSPTTAFVSCPISNLVLGGFTTMHDITHAATTGLRPTTASRSCATWRRRSTRTKKQVRLAQRRADISYDRADRFARASISCSATMPALRGGDAGRRACCTPGRPARRPWRCAASSRRCPTAASTCSRFRKRRTAARPGPTSAPARSRPTSRRGKPRSKVLILDANADVTSKGPLFKKAWAELYPGIIEYRGNSKAVDVDAATHDAVKLEFDDVKGDVLNVVPPHDGRRHRAKAGLITANNRWCDVDWLTHRVEGGQGRARARRRDAVAPADAEVGAAWPTTTPRSCAAAIVALLNGARAESVADDHQHLLQLRLRQGGDPRLVGAQVGRRRATLIDRAGIGRRVGRAQRGRGRPTPGTGPAPSGLTRWA